MTKNIIIALLTGLLIGSNLPRANADTSSISRADLFTAAALIGVLASPNWNPKITAPCFGTPSTTQLVRQQVQNLLENK